MSEKSPADASDVVVEAIGEPGQRRFRLMTLVGGETFILWMEKQQLDALGQALGQVVDQIPGFERPVIGVSSGFGLDPSTRNQFRVGRMELGYEEDDNRIVVIAFDMAADTDDGPTVSFRLSPDQAWAVSEDAARVVAAGRPRCVLCGAPMEPSGHACPEQNGHLPGDLRDLHHE